MKEWFNRMFLSDELLGDKILSILIGIFAIVFVLGWAFILLFFGLHSILDFIKWINRKLGYSNYALEDKLDSISERMGKVFRLPLKLIPNSVYSFFYYNQTKIRFFKSIAIGISIPIIAFLVYLFSSSSPINDFWLITKSTTAIGYITKAEAGTDVVETNDGRSSKEVYFYNYDYSFTLPSGTIVNAYGSEAGELPENLVNLENPYQVEVEYLADNPKVARVKGMDSNDTTVLQWIRRRMFIQTIIFLFLCYWGYAIIRDGLKEYSTARNKATTDAN